VIKKNKISRELSTTFFAIVFLFMLKTYYLFLGSDLGNVLTYASSFAHDSLLLIVNYWLFLGLLKIKYIKRFAKIIFYLFFVAFFLFGIIYTPLILDILSFPVNIFRADSSMAGFMLEFFISAKIIFLSLLGLLFAFLSSYYLPTKTFNSSKKTSITLGAVSVIIVIFGVLTAQMATNSIIYSVNDELAHLFANDKGTANIKKIIPPIASEPNQDFSFLNKQFKTIPQIESKYKKVVMLVMETMSTEMYDKALVYFPLDFADQCQKFTRYNTQNLDSHTALLTMLNSITIPYRAYTDASRYEAINGQNNLVKFFNKNGYYTAFLIPAPGYNVRFSANPKDWDKMVFHNDSDSKDFVCLNQTKVDTGCEDMAVFDDTINIVKNNEKVFTFHEMIYGHTAEWFTKTGVTTEEYYDNMFNRVVAELKKDDIWKDTLFIITADHGPRKNPQNTKDYNIPLLFCANDIDESENNSFYSEVDFKDLLLSKLAQTAEPKERERFFTIGNSSRLVYGMIKRDGGHVFIDDSRLGTDTNLSDSELEKFNADFQEYLNYFETLKQHAVNKMTGDEKQEFMLKQERYKKFNNKNKGKDKNNSKDKRRPPLPEVLPDNWDTMTKPERRAYVQSYKKNGE